jgi:hypothetical protein
VRKGDPNPPPRYEGGRPRRASYGCRRRKPQAPKEAAGELLVLYYPSWRMAPPPSRTVTVTSDQRLIRSPSLSVSATSVSATVLACTPARRSETLLPLRHLSPGLSGLHGEQFPGPWYPFWLVLTALCEIHARPDDQVLDCPRDQDIARFRRSPTRATVWTARPPRS